LLLRRDNENGGALVPLDEADIETVRIARANDPARAEKGRVREAERASKETAEDRAVRQAVDERPGIPTRDLVKRVQAIAKCGPGKAEVAIARVAPSLEVRPGPRNARLHYPPRPSSDRPPESSR
jgi:hypothetical protein